MANLFPTQASDAAVAPQRDRGGGYWRDLDWILLIAAFALSLMGSLLVWSASRADLASESDPQSYLKRHLINIGVALVLGFIASRINYRLLRAYTPVVYVASMVLLLVPFVPGLGVTIAGARAWIDVPLGLTIQPSEFAKITVILMMAALLSERRDREEEPSAQDVLLALTVAAIPTAIILVQNDTGTVLILAAVSLSIVAVSGVRTRWLVGLIAAAILGVLVSIQLGLLQEYQVDRLTSFISPDEDVSASAYNANQARIAAAGGIEAVVRVLGEHQANAAVMEEACGALCNIGWSDEALQKRIKDAGAEPLVRAAVAAPDATDATKFDGQMLLDKLGKV